jgi:hypothetical protein
VGSCFGDLGDLRALNDQPALAFRNGYYGAPAEVVFTLRCLAKFSNLLARAYG